MSDAGRVPNAAASFGRHWNPPFALSGDAPFVAALVRSPLLIRSVESGAGGVRIIHARTLSHLAHLASKESCAVIVYEAGFGAMGQPGAAAPITGGASCPVVVAMSTGPDCGAVADVYEMLRYPRDHCSFVVWPDDLRRAVESSLTLRSEPTAVSLILERVLPMTPVLIRGHVAHATIMAQHDCSVELLARAGKIVESTLGERFRTSNVAPPRVWIGGLRSVHAGSRHLRHGVTVQNSAKRGGFQSTSDLGHCVGKWTGHSLTWWRENGGFDALLDECVRRCTAA